ncbi:MAG: trypsin-like peptidase domain-containing protein [Bacteriovoracaceae bacterium]|nr:trypsin-like peptidase domain-containing protein [Bacteriovoracaceae bacterium]
MYYYKWILTSLFVYQSAFASINPDRVLNHLFFVNKEPSFEQGQLITEGISVEPSKKHANRATISKNRRMKVYVKEDFYQFVQDKAMSVFEIKNETSANTDSHGSGFLLDGNIVITNHHVIFSKYTQNGCHTTRLKVMAQENDTSSIQYLSCKEVLYCDELNDFCLVEFYPLKYRRQTYDLIDLFPKVQFDTTYLTTANPRIFVNSQGLIDNQAELISINNSFGLGIQASSGYGFIVKKMHKEIQRECRQKKDKRRKRCLERQRKKSITQLHHFAPVFQGASGSPVFNREGSVVAITRAMTADEQYGKHAVNYATPINVIIDKLKADNQLKLVQLFENN